MGAYPHPFHTAILQFPGDRAMVVTHANRKTMAASGQALKVERGMLRIAQPQMIILFGKRLDLLGKSMKQLPKPCAGSGFHAWAGHSSVLPA